MREIKFRTWSLATKTFNYDPFHLCIIQGGLNSWLSKTEREGFILQQFTGLKDKNGREIYEGDIIQEKWLNFQKEELEQKYLIKFGEYINSEGFPTIGFYRGSLQQQKEEWGGNLYAIKDEEEDRREVIGNIFENPELLNNK